MALADDLAGYTAERSFDDLDAETVEVAKTRVIDAVACTFPAMQEDPVRAVLRYAEKTGGERTATVYGTGRDAEVSAAALANGALIRYLDWNDTYLSKEPAHPSDNLGAILPVAEAYGCTGEEVITATALAYELQCRLCDAAPLRTAGFDHVNYGLVSATLAAGFLMGLDEEELAEAVNIAVNGHIALRQARAGELTAWKGFAFANAARNAVVAAQLAAEGVEGPKPVFEGRFGFFNQVSGRFDLELEAFGGNGGGWKLNETMLKYYPVEYHAQAAVECALTLREEHDLEPGDIERVENATYEAAVSIIGEEEEKWRPETRETADHSMPYCIARALLDGEMTLAQFTPAKVHDPAVRDLMGRITIEEDSTFTEQYGERFPHRMVVHTRRGDTHTCTVEYPRGHPENPLSRDGLRDRLRSNAAATDVDADALFAWLMALEQHASLEPLAARMAVEA